MAAYKWSMVFCILYSLHMIKEIQSLDALEYCGSSSNTSDEKIILDDFSRQCETYPCVVPQPEQDKVCFIFTKTCRVKAEEEYENINDIFDRPEWGKDDDLEPDEGLDADDPKDRMPDPDNPNLNASDVCGKEWSGVTIHHLSKPPVFVYAFDEHDNVTVEGKYIEWGSNNETNVDKMISEEKIHICVVADWPDFGEIPEKSVGREFIQFVGYGDEGEEQTNNYCFEREIVHMEFLVQNSTTEATEATEATE